MNKNFYSPTMLTKYINCKHIISNEYYEKPLKLKRNERTITDSLRIESGIEHEISYFKELKKKYSKIKDIKSLKKLSIKDKIKETIKSLKEGYELIYGGWLQSKDWVGEFDFLEINKDLKSALGEYSYEILDTKNASKVKGINIYQLGVYVDLLKDVQGVLPKNFYFILKDKKKRKIKLSEVYDTYRYHKKSYENFLSKGIKKTIPEKCSYCNFCDWSEQCQSEWEDKRHVNQILGNNKKNCQKFIQNGIKTYDALAKLDKKKKIEGLRDEVRIKLIEQAKLQLDAEKEGVPKFKYIEENYTLNKGFNLLPEPDPNDIFFDIESVQDYVYPGKLEYLFGIFFEENGKKVFRPFWAHNRQEEKKNVIKFFKFTKEHFKKYPKAKIYHYAPYEITALERLTSIHKVHTVDYDHYLNLNKFVDLYRVVKQGIYVSQKSYSIKDIEKFYDFKRTSQIKKGDVSEEFYIQWLENNDQKLLDKIEEYNKEDCLSAYRLRKWLMRIKPEQTRFFISEKEQMELRGFEEKLLEYQEKFKNSKIQNTLIGKLTSDVVGFYNREQKVPWRHHFNRKDLSDEELIEDRECIANMKLTSVYQDKKSFCYKYIFPEQEYKLKKGKRVIIANNADPDRKDYAGTIQDLDQFQKSLLLRKGISKEEKKLPKILSIGEQVMSHERFENLNNNIYSFCDNVLDKKDGYDAIKSFINRDIPKIKGIKLGEKIIKSENFDIEIPKIILNLQKTYLYIQGPCGTGKTYQAANAIIELIKNNKKIAITANSHKVIHNLLERVEKLADKQKIIFRGLKKGSDNEEEESFYKGKLIKTDKNDKHFINELHNDKTLLFAGTKYHLSQKFYHNKLDFLFVDEASQISVADLVALGGIAKNIILVGDSQQLGQPVQGSHPGDSGKSVLDYLLEGKETISDNKGIFLNKTYRLHPNINDFISENFYENRLIINQENAIRKIDYKKNSLIKSEGIHTILMDHKDRSQTSEEEFKIIKKLVNELVGCNFTDFDKSERKITLNDILIISPFNAQVNFLKERLDKYAKIGTIDKWQGAEAPVVIISMTSSSVEDLPRNKKFFFDRNRLNVAISRAQCSSIILFNPRLLETAPVDYNEFRLINNFQKLMKYKIN